MALGLRGGILRRILTVFRHSSENIHVVVSQCSALAGGSETFFHTSSLQRWCWFLSHIPASTQQLLHKAWSSGADGPSLERLFLSAVPLLPHHFLRFHSEEQPHKAITPSALCRVMISFPFLPNTSNVTSTAGIYRGPIPASCHRAGVVSTGLGTQRKRE